MDTLPADIWVELFSQVQLDDIFSFSSASKSARRMLGEFSDQLLTITIDTSKPIPYYMRELISRVQCKKLILRESGIGITYHIADNHWKLSYTRIESPAIHAVTMLPPDALHRVTKLIIRDGARLIVNGDELANCHTLIMDYPDNIFCTGNTLNRVRHVTCKHTNCMDKGYHGCADIFTLCQYANHFTLYNTEKYYSGIPNPIDLRGIVAPRGAITLVNDRMPCPEFTHCDELVLINCEWLVTPQAAASYSYLRNIVFSRLTRLVLVNSIVELPRDAMPLLEQLVLIGGVSCINEDAYCDARNHEYTRVQTLDGAAVCPKYLRKLLAIADEPRVF